MKNKKGSDVKEVTFLWRPPRAAATFGLGGTAFANGAPEPSAAYPGGAPVAAGGGSDAVVRVAYTCTTNVSPANHLFVAVKQGPNVSPETPSSDETTTAFLSTNWNSDSCPNALNCDGKRHVQQIIVKPQPRTGYGPLKNGRLSSRSACTTTSRASTVRNR